MFCAELRYLDAAVRSVDDLLLHAFHLIPEDQRILFLRFRAEIFQGGRVFRLLDGENPVAFLFQLADDRQRLFPVFPFHCLLCAQSGFMHLPVLRGGGDAAEVYLFYSESIRSPEHGTDVILAADIVQHDNRRQFFCFLELCRADSVQFLIP